MPMSNTGRQCYMTMPSYVAAYTAYRSSFCTTLSLSTRCDCKLLLISLDLCEHLQEYSTDVKRERERISSHVKKIFLIRVTQFSSLSSYKLCSVLPDHLRFVFTASILG